MALFQNMNTNTTGIETARQAYIRLLRERIDFPDSLQPTQRNMVLQSELINSDYLDGEVNMDSSGMFPSTVITGLPKPKGRLFLEELEKAELDASIARRHRESFKSFDRRKLSVMDDKSLAEWQSDFKQDEPEWRLAEHEWQRRLTVEEIKAVRWAAIIGVCAIIFGALLTKVLEKL
jgi:hypothetical protein